MAKIDEHTWTRTQIEEAINWVVVILISLWRIIIITFSANFCVHVLRDWCMLLTVVIVLSLKYL